MSAERFERLGHRVNIIVYFGNRYVYSKDGPQKWKIQVEFSDNGTQIQFEELGFDLYIAMETAYERLDKIVSHGMGASAMLPAIEHQPKSLTDDEIPF
jgi:hypothetical protein